MSNLLDAMDKYEEAERALRDAQMRKYDAQSRLVVQLVEDGQTYFLRPVNLGILRRELRKKL